MPTSNLHVAPHVINLVETRPHGRVLDVGPGWGKYATLLREYLNVKPFRVDAVEAWQPYVADHRLERLYDTVYVGDACAARWTQAPGVDVNAATVLATYDVVLMVDVIEHMPAAQAAALVHSIPGRVVICTPVDFFHNGDGLPPTEDHVSHWTRQAVDGLATGRRPVEYYAEDRGAVIARLGPQAGWSPSVGQARRAYT